MIELRNFKGADFYAWQGAASFPDGRSPMIAEGEKATLVACSFDEGFGVVIDVGNMFQAFKIYDDVDVLIANARIIAQILDCDLTVEFLTSIGFECY